MLGPRSRHSRKVGLEQKSTAMLAAAIFAAVGMSTTSVELQIVSLALSAAIILMIAWVNFGRPWWRSRQLRKPIDVRFKLEPRADAETATELRVPANSTVQIDFRIEPRVHHMQNELILRLSGDQGKRPYATSVVNTFIKEGAGRTQDPASNVDHYIDYNNNYHIKNRGEHTKGNTYALGFSVRTREPGRYPVRFSVMTEDGDGHSANDLTLIVE